MHRFTASLLALAGALAVPHGNGRAEPRSANAHARAESAARDPDAIDKSDASKKRPESTATETSRTTRPEPPGSRKGDGTGANPSKAVPASKATERDATGAKKPPDATTKSDASSKGAAAWTRGQPGVVKLVRGAETLEVRVLDKKQRLVSTTLSQFARFLRSKGGADHPIDARLVTLVATVSDHFGGREVNVVSGFRPYSPRQYSRHSNHNEGRAIDFSIKGIANETVRDYCRTLHNVGVGYYPNSLFVHLDVRDSNAYWVDYAAPGQAPRYHAPDGQDDDDERSAITSVDTRPSGNANPSDTLRADVARGRNAGRGGDNDVTGQRGVFVSP